MKSNVGTIDKVIRISLAVAFNVLFFTGTVTGTLGLVLLVLGGVLLSTSVIGFCPVYTLLGINSCGIKKG